MIYFALVFDFYTPPDLSPKVFKSRVEKCFKPILKLAEKEERALTINYCASLAIITAKKGFSSFLKKIEDLSKKGKIELINSAAYNALLPKIPDSEINQQIKKNIEINRKFIDGFSPKGFIPPELGFSNKVKNVIESAGFDWILLDESGFPLKNKKKVQFPNQIFLFKDSNLKAFFINNHLSEKIANKQDYLINDLKKEIRNQVLKKREKKTLRTVFERLINTKEDCYLIIYFDHLFFQKLTKKKKEFLQDFLALSKIDQEEVCFVMVGKLSRFFNQKRRIAPKPSAKMYPEVKSKNPFLIWENSRNKIQNLQWQLVNLALTTFSNPEIEEADQIRVQARNFLDQGLSSDQFLWSSHKPFWNLKIIEKGARFLQNVVVLMGKDQQKKEGKELYQEIMTTGRTRYGERVIKE